MKKLIKECTDQKKKPKASQFASIKAICNEGNLRISNDFAELCAGVVQLRSFDAEFRGNLRRRSPSDIWPGHDRRYLQTF